MWNLPRAYRSYIAGRHFDNSGGRAIESDELDLESSSFLMNKHHGTDITRFQFVVRDRLREHHSVMFLYHIRNLPQWMCRYQSGMPHIWDNNPVNVVRVVDSLHRLVGSANDNIG